MSDLATVANRLIPITVELYTKVTETYLLNPIVVNKDDSEYKILFTLTNKDATSPYAVNTSDVSNADKVEFVFTNNLGSYIKSATNETDGTDGEVFFMVSLNDLHIIGDWFVHVKLTYDDNEINYPKVPFIVE
jgi:ribosome biogenesis protein Nip4